MYEHLFALVLLCLPITLTAIPVLTGPVGNTASVRDITSMGFSGAQRLDVTFYSFAATPKLNDTFYVGGYCSGDTKSIVGNNFTFYKIFDTGTGTGLPEGHTLSDTGDYGRTLYLPTGAGRLALYHCDANATTGNYERLQTVLIAEKAEIKPESQTRTVSWGENITLTMETQEPEASLQWRHNGTEKSKWAGKSSITIVYAKTSDGGIYECYSNETQRSQGKNGFMRLIVRGCPNGKWGLPDCFASCPTCYNGGVCNSDSGECICPPGFIGPTCGIGCGRSRFGMQCSLICSSSDDDFCRTRLFCIADPYGCSCGTSYTGLDCASDCPVGKYGAGCSQTCHCIDVCRNDTGECISGSCLSGWSGPSCQIPDSCGDGFYGELCNYNCHCKDNVACDRSTGVCSNGECAPGWINAYTVDCQQDGSLKIWFLYNVKTNPGEDTSIICEVGRNPVISSNDVLLVDHSESVLTRTSHQFSGMYLLISNYSSVYVGEGMSYTCKAGDQSKELSTFDLYVLPKFSENNVPRITPQATRVTVSWERWQERIDHGDGPAEVYKVYFKRTEQSDWIAHQDFHVVDPDLTSYTTDISYLDWSTSYDVTVTVKRPGPKGEGSKETLNSVITLCDVPTEWPTITGVTSPDPSKLKVTYTVPSSSKIKCDSNGYIENFHLKYRKVNTWEEYEEIISSDGSVRMLTITGLLPFTMYEFVLSFNNRDEQSPWSPLTKARTAEDVPSKPRNVELNPAVYTMAVQWLVPDPTNGVINKYIISYWETYNEATTRREEEVTAISQNINRYLITDLTLKVSYTVQVGAYTTAGLGELSDMVSATTTEQDDSNESTSNSLSIIAMVASIIAVVIVVCIGIALVVIVRRQNPEEVQEEVNLDKRSKEEDETAISLPVLEQTNVKLHENVPDEMHQYDYIKFLTQQSRGETSTLKSLKMQANNDENLYTGLQKEMQNEPEYKSLNFTEKNSDTVEEVTDIGNVS